MRDRNTRAPILPPTLLAVVLVVFGGGCDIVGGGEDGPFAWARPGAYFVYDLDLRGDTTFLARDIIEHRDIVVDDATRALTIVTRDGTHNGYRFGSRTIWGLMIREVNPPLVGLYFDVREEGLHTLEFAECGPPGLLARRSLASLRVPAQPKRGQRLAQRPCRGAISGYVEVAEVGVRADSPWGPVEAFVLTGEMYGGMGWRETWSAGRGLLRMELLDSAGEPYATYSLVEAGHEAP